MTDFAGDSGITTVIGVLHWTDIEGGFWSLTPESGESDVVLQDWQPESSLVDGSRVRARVRVREEQFGFIMAGTYADVVDIHPA